MKCRVHFYLLNDDYSQEYADERYNGEESELNRKFEWEDELEIKGEVTGYTEHKDSVVPLQGTMPSGEEFKEEVKAMRVFTLHNNEEPVASLSCSESLFNSIETSEAEDELLIKIILNDKEPLSNPVPGMYVAAQEFPESLVF